MDHDRVKSVFQETSILSQLNHDSILKLHEVYMNDQHICLITDLMDTNLLDYLNEHYDLLTIDDKLRIFSNIVQGV